MVSATIVDVLSHLFIVLIASDIVVFATVVAIGDAGRHCRVSSAAARYMVL